ncbi:MAG: NAD(P)-binding protein, partial [Calothrix sp. SM1_5_4]|nr:NAD(P)-binding protein [Calothrix sp. SM1_5_4]
MASNRFIPGQFQPELQQDRFIISHQPEGEDVVPLDVVFVGAGPAGLCGAIELARLVKEDGQISVEIGVLEKAGSLGGHSLSGAVINPAALRELFPDLKDSELPFRRPVSEERVFLMTKDKAIRIPTPPTMKNHGYQIAS